MNIKDYLTAREVAQKIVADSDGIRRLIENAEKAATDNFPLRTILEDIFFAGMITGAENAETINRMRAKAVVVPIVPEGKGS